MTFCSRGFKLPVNLTINDTINFVKINTKLGNPAQMISSITNTPWETTRFLKKKLINKCKCNIMFQQG